MTELMSLTLKSEWKPGRSSVDSLLFDISEETNFKKYRFNDIILTTLGKEFFFVLQENGVFDSECFQTKIGWVQLNYSYLECFFPLERKQKSVLMMVYINRKFIIALKRSKKKK